MYVPVTIIVLTKDGFVKKIVHGYRMDPATKKIVKRRSKAAVPTV
jgi:hypothetical protein